MKSLRHTLAVVGLSTLTTFGALGSMVGTSSAAPATYVAKATVTTSNSKALAAAAAVALADLGVATSSGDADAMARYVAQRDALAIAVANSISANAGLMQAAWANADTAHQQALLAAISQLGVPYRRNTSSPGKGFDCSGLTTYAWGAAGVSLYRQSATQIQRAAKVDAFTAQAGDLVYYPGHVSMWLGVDRAIVHAVGTGRTVEVGYVKTSKSFRMGNPAN